MRFYPGKPKPPTSVTFFNPGKSEDVWACDWCHRHFKTKKGAEKHEKKAHPFNTDLK